MIHPAAGKPVNVVFQIVGRESPAAAAQGLAQAQAVTELPGQGGNEPGVIVVAGIALQGVDGRGVDLPEILQAGAAAGKLEEDIFLALEVGGEALAPSEGTSR